MKIIVTVIINKDNKLLMVQEAKKECYGQWNFPAGHLEPNENIYNGAIREAKEETGYDVKLTSLLSIQNYSVEDDTLLRIIFNADIISKDTGYDKDEILDVKWIPIDEIDKMGENLRGKNSLLEIVKDVKANNQYPLEIVKNLL